MNGSDIHVVERGHGDEQRDSAVALLISSIHKNIPIAYCKPIAMEGPDGESNSAANDPAHSGPGGLSARFEMLCCDSWLMEISSCILAVLSLTSLTATLAVQQEKPMPEWPKPISINALIAVLTVLMKAGLVKPLAEGISALKWDWYRQPRELSDMESLDQASRGPWGAFLLLLKPRRHYLASLGAALIIFSMAVDPFSQQVVQFVPCLHESSIGAGSVPKCNSYSAVRSTINVNYARIDNFMAIAITTGLLDIARNASSLITGSCATGNCTFAQDNGASFSTIGMCHSCLDVSSQVENLTDGNGPSFKLPNTVLQNIYIGRNNLTASWTDGGAPAFMTDLTTVRFLMSTPNFDRVVGFRCSLFPCVKTYGLTFTYSMLNETLASTPVRIGYNVRNRQIEGDSLEPDRVAYMLVTNQTLVNGKWTPCKGSTERSKDTDWLVAPENIDGIPDRPEIFNNDTSTMLYYPDECVWRFGAASHAAIVQYLDSYFNFKPADYTQSVLRNTIKRYTNGIDGDLHLLNMWRDGEATLKTMDEYFGGLTDVMTAAMRIAQPGYDRQDHMVGRLMVSQTCLHVRWVWLSFPIAVVMSSVLFLVALMRKAPTNTPHWTWKSSPLALLHCQVDEKDSTRIHPPQLSNSEIVVRAQTTKVKLAYI